MRARALCVNPLAITGMAAVNALGRGVGATLEALRAGRTGLRPNDFSRMELPTWIGRVDGVESEPVAGGLAAFDCRNNRLAQLGLHQDGFAQAVARARASHGAHRIAVLIGTSTSGILQTELAYQARDAKGLLPPTVDYRHQQNLYSVSDFVRRHLGLQGPAATISTACSSSAKVFASASRFIRAGVADAVVVGGVDSLCLTTLHGFSALDLVSSEPCRPFARDRKGISIGEAAGFALVERDERSDIVLLGYGESSDAHHISAPHPDGDGALAAMQGALAISGLGPHEIGYVNAHGTGTPANDRSEDRALTRLFGATVPVSSTKGWTGHTLGAAGIIEAIISCLCLRHGFIPATLNTTTLDPELSSAIRMRSEVRPLQRVLSNSFGFGGSNCSLLFGRMT